MDKMGKEDRIGRLLIAEAMQKRDSGALLEHGIHSIGVLDTSSLFCNVGSGSSQAGVANGIERASGNGIATGSSMCNSVRILRAEEGRMDPFAIVQFAPGVGNTFVVLSDGVSNGSVLLRFSVPTGRSVVLSANVTDDTGLLVARMDRSPDANGFRYSIRFSGAPADGALVILSLTAIVKMMSLRSAQRS